MNEELQRVLKELHGITNRFGLVGDGVAGDLVHGYTLDVQNAGGAFGGGGPSPPPSGAGACCLPDDTCTITTSDGCTLLGGRYLGDNSSCTPNPCPHSGGCPGVEEFAFCAEWTVHCTGGSSESDCPCFFDLSWSDNCCNTPPSIQCGAFDPTNSGTCNCTGYEPEGHSSVQASAFVQDGICKVFIFINVVPQCGRPGFEVCSIPLGQNYIFNYDDHSASIDDILGNEFGSCTFHLGVTW